MLYSSFISRNLLLRTLVFSSALFSSQTSLQRSIPEKEGVTSESIINFLNAIKQSKSTELHSFILLRHGKVISESYVKPYHKDLKNRLYSCSKTFVATAIGFAVQEKRLNVNDKVISFFPDNLPSQLSDNLKELSIKNLLTMSTGMEKEPSFIRESEDDWVNAYLAVKIQNKPGTKFNYSSLATFMLSAIIQKVTGETLVEYLKPRLFDPLNIVDYDWEKNPQGINTGGWGLRLKTEDLAKFGQLFLQNGRWNGKQIISEDWINEASSVHILQKPDADEKSKSENDWLQGYGYQMWRSRFNSFRGDGAYGQLMMILPEQDAVVILIAENSNFQEEIDLVWNYLLPGFANNALPDNENGSQNLKVLEEQLSIKALKSKIFQNINKTYVFGENSEKYQSVSIVSKGKKLELRLTINNEVYPLVFDSGHWHEQETMKVLPTSDLVSKTDYKKLYPAKISNSFKWIDSNNLELKTIYLETPHSHKVKIKFYKDFIDFKMTNSADFGTKTKILKATYQK